MRRELKGKIRWQGKRKPLGKRSEEKERKKEGWITERKQGLHFPVSVWPTAPGQGYMEMP